MKLYFCDIQKEKENIEAFFSTLSEADRAEFDSLHPDRRIEKLAGRMLLSRAARENGITDFMLKQNPYGKPYIDGSFHFNISHSADRVMLATDASPVGADIEQIREIDLRITRKFATEREKEYIISAPDASEQYRRFFIVWTLKEAYIKAEGEGMHIPLKTVEFTVSDTLAVTSNSGKWQFETVITPDNYVYSVATGKEREDA